MSHRRNKRWNRLVENTVRKVVLMESNFDKTTNTATPELESVIDAMYNDFGAFREMLKELGGGWALKDKVRDEDNKVVQKKVKGKDGKEKMVDETVDVPDTEWQKRIQEIFGTKEELMKRFEDLNKALNKGKGYAKAYMPALEGIDVQFVQDALDSTQGQLGVDTSSEWNQGEDNFKDWYEKNQNALGDDGLVNSDEEGQAPEAQNSSYYRRGNVMNETLYRWGQLAGLLTEDKDGADDEDTNTGSWTGGGPTPFVGPEEPLPGAPKVPAGTPIDPSKIEGEALAFLKKGKGTGDKMEVEAGAGLASSQLKPTQKEVKLGKSLAFALQNIGQDFDGAYADDEGNILDGHHRWSGQFLRKGDTQHTGLNVIKRNSAYKGDANTQAFLRMLTSIGNALGRGTKTK